MCFDRKKKNTKGDPMEPEAKALMIEPPSYSIDPVEMRRQHYQTPGTVACHFSKSVRNWKRTSKVLIHVEKQLEISS